MRFAQFEEKFNELPLRERVAIFNDWAMECDPVEAVFDFDEDFFNTYFDSPMEAARATCFGSVNWSDEYIKFNAYGNLKSMNEWEVADHASDFLAEIFEVEDAWKSYIQLDDEEDEDVAAQEG